MKTIRKKGIALLLAVLMSVNLLSIGALADEEAAESPQEDAAVETVAEEASESAQAEESVEEADEPAQAEEAEAVEEIAVEAEEAEEAEEAAEAVEEAEETEEVEEIAPVATRVAKSAAKSVEEAAEEEADAEETATEADPVEEEAAEEELFASLMNDTDPVYVAQIGETPYETLAEALEAGGDIKLLGNVTGSFKIAKTAVLDLNGYTISNTTANTPVLQITSSDAVLTIKDSSLTKTGTVIGEASGCKTVDIQEGKAIIQSGTFQTKSFAVWLQGNGNAQAEISGGVFNAATAVSAYMGATVEISGGQFFGSLPYACNTAIAANNLANITITGGTFGTEANDCATPIRCNGTGNITITGGTFHASVNSVDGCLKFDGTGTVRISGGDFTGQFIKSKSESTLEISAGTFSTNVSAYCVDGYVAVKNASGKYEIVVKTDVAQIGSVTYATLQDAIDAAKSVTMIELLRDTLEDVTVAAGKTVTLNLDVYTLSGQITNNGNLTVDGTTSTIEATDETIVNNGTLVINGGTVYAAKNKAVVNAGSGSVTMNDGTLSAKWYRTLQNNGTGSVTVNGGTISATEVAASNYSTGTLTIAGGTLTASNGWTVQNENAGDLIVKGGKISTVANQAIRNYSNGSVIINDGEVSANGNWTIVNAGSGSITVNGGTIRATNYRALQNDGTGSITVNGGTISALQVAASNYSTGTMTITGGTLTASGGYTVQNENQGWTSGKVGTLTINGGTISTNSATGYAIYNYDGGDVKISGTAKIEAPNANYVIYNYYSGLYIEGGEISAKGSSYAIYAIQSSEGQFVITGGKFSFDPSQQVGVIAEGYQVTQTDNMWTVEKVSASSDDPVTEDPATEYVAQIGDQKYATLVEATRAAKNGETVTVIADTNMGEAENYEVQILVENKAITLDLNGKTVTSIYGYRLAAVEPGGTLTIKDSSENGNGKLLNTKVPLSFTDTFQPTVVLVREGGTFVLESGTLEGNWFGVINNGGTVNITGGTVSANDNRGGNALKNVSGQTTISGGMFTGVAQMAAIDSTDGTISITGGTFSSDPSTPADYVAEGYKSVPNPDTTYTVVPKVYVAEIANGKKYETLQEAIDAAQDGNTITVYAGTVEPVYIDKSVTIKGTLGENGEYLSVIKRDANWTVPEKYSDWQDSTVYIAAPNVTLEDIKVEVNDATEFAFSNKATGADGFTVKNCWILGLGSGTAYNVQPGFIIQDSLIENWGSLNSLNVQKHTAITVTGNTYKNVSVLFKAQCSTVPSEKMVFSNNTLKNDDGSKGYLEFGTYVTANGPAASGCAEVELALNQELKMAVAKPIKVTTSAVDGYIVSAANVTDGTWTRAYSVVRLADQVAKVLSFTYGDQYYATLQDAVDNMPYNSYPTTITLLKDVDKGSGLATFATHSKNVTIDFNQHTYAISDPAGNLMDALHFENGSTVTLKNGTLRVAANASGVETLIRNNGNLTLENMILDVSSMTSTSIDVGTSGTFTITGDSQIIQLDDGEMSFSGSGGVATIENVRANGTISASENALVIKGGTFDSNPSAYVPKGYETIANDDGTWTVDSIKVAEANGVKYASLDEAFKNAPNGSTIKVLLDIEGLDHTFKLQSYNLPSLTLDLDGHTIHVEKNNDPQYFAVFNVVWGYLTITGNGRVIADKGTNLRSAYTMTNYASIHIESGTFLCGDLFDTILHAYNGEITVTGGTFNNDPSAYVPDGYEVIILDKVDEVYGQLYKVVPIGTAEASINGAKYETLQGALAAVKATETITVLKDSALPEKGVTIPENVSIQTQEAVQDGYFTVPDGCLLLVEDSTYTAASNKVSKIELDLPEEITLSIPAGETATETITATLLPSYVTGKTVTWESSNTNVATVDENGVVTTVGSGTTTITASVVGEATATVTVTVEKFVARIGETKYETLDDAFEAAKETGATVIVVSDVAGEIPVGVTVVTEVEITGTFTAPDGYFLSVNGNTYTVAEKTITLNKTSVSMTSRTNAIATETLIATLNFETSSEVAWATSNDKVATVEKGVVTAVGTGTTTITASVDNLEARATVKVTMEYRVTVYIDGVKDSEVYRPENSRVDVNVIGRETMGSKNFQGWALNAPDAEIVGEDVIYSFTLTGDIDAYAIYESGAVEEEGGQPHARLSIFLQPDPSTRSKIFSIDYSRALFLADGYTLKESGLLYTTKTISDDDLKLTDSYSVPAGKGIVAIRDTNTGGTGFSTSVSVGTKTLSIRGYVIVKSSAGEKVYYTDMIQQAYKTYDKEKAETSSEFFLNS